MKPLLPLVVCSIFVLLALWHVRMAFGSMRGESGAVPSVDGKPLFVPSRASTLAVAAALLLFAVLVAATAGALQLGAPLYVLSWLSYALALGLFARAIGEFRYVGFFKRVRGSRFARMDTFLYSPLCLLLAAGVAAVASR
jgi:fatty acid desaturase